MVRSLSGLVVRSLATGRTAFVTHPRRNTVLVLAVIVISAGTIGTFWALSMADRAEQLARDLRASGESAESAIATADTEAVRRLAIEMSDSRAAIADFDDDLWPLKALGSVFGWIPTLGDNITGAPDLADRLSNDIDAALSLLDAADDLMASYRLVSTGDQGIISILQALPREDELQPVFLSLEAADVSLQQAENTAADVEDGRLWGRLGEESAELRQRELRLRGLVDWSQRTADSLLELARLREISAPLVGLLDSGESLERTAFEAMPLLETTALDAHQAVFLAVQETPDSVSDSPIGRSLADLEPLLAALADTARAGTLAWNVAKPALQLTEAKPGGLIGDDSNVLESLDALFLGHSELVTAREILVDARVNLHQTRFQTTGAANAAVSLGNAVRDMTDAIGFMADFSAVGSDALGADGPRTYLVLGQTSDELRASGGFVSGSWVVTFDSGQLTDVEYHDIVEVDDFHNLDAYPRPPELLVRHMDAKVWLLRDVSWEPDFPIVANRASEIFQIGQGERNIDGVIAITQWALVRLGEGMGGVPTEDELLDPSVLLSTLEAGTDLEGRGFMDVMLKGFIEGLKSDLSSERIFPILLAGEDSLRRKDILVHMFQPELQETISRAGWGGELARTDNDRIAIVDSNIGWSKVDRNIDRSINYIVDINPASVSTGRLMTSYFNRSTDSFNTCDIQEPIHVLSYQELKSSCYWNLFRVYLADDSVVTGNETVAVPPGSVFARLGKGVSGEDSVEIDFGPGGKFVSGILVVPPGEGVSTSIDLILPETSVTLEGEMASYTLEIPFQPGSLSRDVGIQMNMPPGYKFHSSSHVPSLLLDGEVHFQFLAEQDELITVTMGRGEPAVSMGEPVVEEVTS